MIADLKPYPSIKDSGGIVNLASCWQSYRMLSYRGYRFPPDIISHAVWLYHRFALSFRDVEDVLARRGVGGELLLSPQSVEIIKFGDPGSGR